MKASLRCRPQYLVFNSLANQIHLEAVGSTTDAHYFAHAAQNGYGYAAAQVHNFCELRCVDITQVKALCDTFHESTTYHSVPDWTEKTEQEGT